MTNITGPHVGLFSPCPLFGEVITDTEFRSSFAASSSTRCDPNGLWFAWRGQLVAIRSAGRAEAPLVAIEAMSFSFDAVTFTGVFSRPVTRDRYPTVNAHTVDGANVVGPHWSVAGTHDFFRTSIRALPFLLVAKNDVV